jgi:hypothetical protein
VRVLVHLSAKAILVMSGHSGDNRTPQDVTTPRTESRREQSPVRGQSPKGEADLLTTKTHSKVSPQTEGAGQHARTDFKHTRARLRPSRRCVTTREITPSGTKSSTAKAPPAKQKHRAGDVLSEPQLLSGNNLPRRHESCSTKRFRLMAL